MLKIIRAKYFRGAKFSYGRPYTKIYYGCEITHTNALVVSEATTFTSTYGLLLWENFFPVNESRRTVEIDTLLPSKRTG